jgi:hypothetical protein
MTSLDWETLTLFLGASGSAQATGSAASGTATGSAAKASASGSTGAASSNVHIAGAGLAGLAMALFAL